MVFIDQNRQAVRLADQVGILVKFLVQADVDGQDHLLGGELRIGLGPGPGARIQLQNAVVQQLIGGEKLDDPVYPDGGKGWLKAGGDGLLFRGVGRRENQCGGGRRGDQRQGNAGKVVVHSVVTSFVVGGRSKGVSLPAKG